jgi:capsular exopolysaccharide synthesis family protein
MFEREEQANKSMYDQLLGRMRQNTVEQNVNQMNIQQVQYPILPNIDMPSKPKPLVLIAVGVIGGLLFAFGYAILRRAADSSFRSIDEAERTLQMPALAAIPISKPKKGLKNKRSTLLQADDPASAQAESIRDLRTALAHLPAGQPRTVQFTSSVPGEGKSFCAANYAVALAHQGLRTLLVDGDLRRPTLSDLLGALSGRLGLADYLSGRAALNDICHPTAIDNLALISAGKHRSKPAELLAQKKEITNLLQTFNGYDCIVIDSAPILAASDPLLLSPMVESVVLVVRARKTQPKEMIRTLQLLSQVGAHVPGFVLNQLPLERTYSYPGYGGKYAPNAA